MDGENNSNNYNYQNEENSEKNVLEEEKNFPDSSEIEGDFEESGKGWWIFSLIFLILLLLGAYWLFYENNGEEKEAFTKEEQSENLGTDREIKETVSSSSLLVKDQSSGGVVFVSSVSLKEPSWIVIREDLNGKMGNILGALWLQKGEHQDESVELLRDTSPLKKYYALIFSDDGDKAFDQNLDLPLKDDNGKMIVSEFKTLSAE